MHVLVVEDDPPTRRFLVDALSDQGYVVSAAGDGAAALERCSQDQPDLVVLDLGLPIMDGLEFLRRRGGDCPAPVVAVSAAHRSPEVSGLGVAAFIAKPFDLNVLFRVIDQEIDGVGEGRLSGEPIN
jgi:two-component system KDP operon response regulator KdpE